MPTSLGELRKSLESVWEWNPVERRRLQAVQKSTLKLNPIKSKDFIKIISEVLNPLINFNYNFTWKRTKYF